MALAAPTLLGYGEQADSASPLAVTLSAPPAANSLVLAFWLARRAGASPADPSISGVMDAWDGIAGSTLEFESADPFLSIGVSRAQQVDPADEDVIFTPPATLTHLQAWVVEIPGAVVGNNGADAIVQAVEKDSGTNQPNIDYATMDDVVNNMFIALMACVGPTPRFQGATPEDAEWGFQQVDVDTLADSTGTDTSALLQYVVGLAETNPNIQGFTGGGFSGGAGIGLEIAEAEGGFTDSVADIAEASDGPSAQTDYNPAAADIALASDLPTFESNLDTTVTDIALGSDQAIGGHGEDRTIEDVAVASEDIATTHATQGTPEIALASDSPEGSVSGGLADAVADGARASDALSAQTDYSPERSDTALASDAASALADFMGSAADIALGSDAPESFLNDADSRFAQDIAIASDQPTARGDFTALLTELLLARDHLPQDGTFHYAGSRRVRLGVD